ncbi:TolC family outer membrane protein [Scleromatobacter humisilvae]|uniref:TolC family outer membrane protein n=1 Tax=Scleromatobacter humisilvae TaxID=2897159 RepID=A0A9X1YDE1_9BURK|nr:TolC family outer membrane protein [Scleromatobacter humisilvae]MCK9684104.1 TolC family outer membrane protein [Scleromatobacter humisilvae]
MRDLMRRSVVVLACALAACRPAQADDLLDVFRLARANDPVLAAADAARLGTHDLADQARAALLPQASATAAIGRERDSGAAQPTASAHTTDVTLGLSQVVFDAGLWLQLKAARLNADAQDATVEAARQQLCLRVATAYFDALLAADILASVQANEDAFAQQVEQSQQRYKAGLDAQVDVDQSRSYQALAHGNTIAARQALVDALAAVAEITGSTPATLKTLRDDLPLAPPSPADPQAWVASALQGNPALWAAQKGVASAESSIAAARAGHLPSLSAGLNLGRPTGAPYGDSSGRLANTAVLTLSVPLFAGGATQARVSQAVHQRDGARDSLETLRRAIERATRAAYGSVVTGMGEVQSTREAVAAAQASLAATRVGREVGNRTQTDVLNAIQTLAQAQAAHAQARHQFILGRLQLQQAAGALTEADLANVNALLQ